MLENYNKTRLKAGVHGKVRYYELIGAKWEQMEAKSHISGNFLEGFWLPASQCPHASSHCHSELPWLMEQFDSF